MRLHRPIGTWLCLLPALWGLSLGAPTFSIKHITLFIIGAVLVRGAGCTINDIWDQRLDAHVERTKLRPLAMGHLSTQRAFLFFCVQMLLASIILFQLNRQVILMGVLVVIPIIIYPLLKRYTYWPQIFLGIIFNWGCLMGWLVHHEKLSSEIILLYVGCVFWTVGYDTIYAFQDYKDDLVYGVKSSALKIGYAYAHPFTLFCYTGFLVCLCVAAALKQHFFLCAGLVLLTPWIYTRITKTQNLSPHACYQFFLWNQTLGLIIWGFILASKCVW